MLRRHRKKIVTAALKHLRDLKLRLMKPRSNATRQRENGAFSILLLVRAGRPIDTFRTMKKAIRILTLGLFLMMLGCATTRPAEPFYTRLYVGSFDDIWLAALKALSDYPLKMSNKDSGKIQSEVVNGPYNELLFAYPDPMELPERFRYSVRLNFGRLVSEDNQALVRIRVIKDLERFHDFYTGWISYPSDGLEERILLYRIEHILRMEHLLSQPAEGSDN
jgi:hypothetical protein